MHERRLTVNKSIGMVVGISALIVAGAASAQGMLLDAAADKVITKYQTATCEELKAQRNQPRTDKEKEAVEFLRNDSQARVSFIDKIAAPVLNKMFDCGMIQ
jgi:phosphoenolpyruvate-protein kinase (PTS system EI component)